MSLAILLLLIFEIIIQSIVLPALCIMMYLIYHNLLIVSEKITITDHYM